MQATHRGMGIPGAGGAVFLKYLGQPIGLLGKIFQAYRTDFDN